MKLDDGRRPAAPSASPGFGEHLTSGNNVVWVALVFGQALVDHCALGVAQWHGRWFCDEARPNDFDEAQAFLGRKLEDFGNVGITHDG
jgi:hypothetical protein